MASEKIWDRKLAVARDLAREAKQYVCYYLAISLSEQAKLVHASGMLEDVEGKQLYARKFGAVLRTDGVLIRHPETKEPCVLVALSDEYGGRFALESRRNRRRSRSTKDINDLLPFELMTEMQAEEWLKKHPDETKPASEES